MELHVAGLNRLMRHLGMLAGPAPEAVACQVLEKFIWLTSEHQGYYYPAVEVGEQVQKGQSLGKITDFEGKVLQRVEAPESGIVLFLVTCMAISKNNPLLSIGA